MSRYDVVVVGAGMIGLASAYYIKKRDPTARVALVDREPDVAQGNSAKSAGGIRAGIFASECNRLLSESSVSFYSYLQENRGIDLGLEFVGYLIIFGVDEFRQNERTISHLKEESKIRILESRDLASTLGMRVSFESDTEAELLGVKDVYKGIFADRAGYLDADKICRFYREEFQSIGGEVLLNTEVKRLVIEAEKNLGIPRQPRTWQAIRLAGVDTGKEIISADTIVLTLGAWTQMLLDALGIDCWAKPKKRQIFVVKPNNEALRKLFNTRGINSAGVLPNTFLPGGVYLKADKRSGEFWIGLSDDIGRAFDLDITAEEFFYYDNIYPVLTKYFPQFEGTKIENMWAGHYAINSVDGNPVIFRKMNLVVATGDSGSGILKGDAIARIVAALCYGESTAELYGGTKFDADRLGVESRRAEVETLIF